MNKKTTERINEIINGKKRLSMPLMTHPGIELIGCSVREAVQKGEIHAQAIHALSQRFPESIASTIIMDLTVEAEAFGCQIEFPEDDVPHIIGTLVDSSSVEKLVVPSLSAGRLPEYLKALDLSAQLMPDKPVYAGAIAPFSLAGRLYGMSEIMIACYLEPDVIHLLLNKCTQFILTYCAEMKRRGCPGVVLAEPAAGLLSNEDCLQFSSMYIRQIVEQLQDESFLIILHNCGNSGQCTEAMVQTGAKALHLGNAISMKAALEACPQDILVMGNIDPVGVLKMMSPQQVRQTVSSLLDETADYPNFILSTGCDVPPHVPFKNIEAYYDTLSAFNLKHNR